MTRVLAKEGFNVVCAVERHGRPRAGLGSLRPAVITLDVIMPGMDGWAVLTALKADPTLADIPVVMVTMTDDRHTGYALGATDYLTKPVDPARLTTILRRYAADRAPAPVLVVEDDDAMRESTRRLLKREGWDVQVAVNGRDALDRVAECTPSLILLDLVMPEMDGFDFIGALRSSPAWQDDPGGRGHRQGHRRRTSASGSTDRSRKFCARPRAGATSCCRKCGST